MPQFPNLQPRTAGAKLTQITWGCNYKCADRTVGRLQHSGQWKSWSNTKPGQGSLACRLSLKHFGRDIYAVVCTTAAIPRSQQGLKKRAWLKRLWVMVVTGGS